MNCDNDREVFERIVLEKCGFNPETSLKISETTGEYKSDVMHFAWVMWKVAKEFYSKTCSAIPDGYALVPKEPTLEMLRVGIRETHSLWIRDAYKAMIEQALIDNAEAQEQG